MTETTVDVPPDVVRIVEGLRDTGYDFQTAIADIVDNSIAAEASIVDVRFGADFSGALVVSIADNGVGMDREGLINAMRYGSKVRPSAKSLGKFGLGLKTASTAFCTRLSVISRPLGNVEPLRATWDLQEMAKSNSWSLIVAAPSPPEVALLNDVAGTSSGTVVLWENIDRLLDTYKERTGKPFRRAIEKLENSLSDHLAVVYQRFLDPSDKRERAVEIKLNGKPVKAWDPFCLAETEKPVADIKLPVQLPDGTASSFRLRSFILPRKEEFKSDANRESARVSNELQGVYVYRENRLIHGPDWMGMFKQEPHFSLLRVELSFDHTMDEAFQVDFKKSRILLDPVLYEHLRDKLLAGPRREAEQRYRKGAASVASGASALLHGPSSTVIQQKAAALSKPRIDSVDVAAGEVHVTNKSGKAVAKLRIIAPDATGPVHITTADTLRDGVLWEPVLGKDGGPAVALNSAHDFYGKAYLPNKTNSPVIQALDYLLWALANAELNNINSDNSETFEEFRVEVSRNLRKLVADLPDPSDTAFGG